MEPVAVSLENEKVCMYNNSHHVCTSRNLLSTCLLCRILKTGKLSEAAIKLKMRLVVEIMVPFTREFFSYLLYPLQ